MIRTQVYIPEPLHEELNHLAQLKSMPMAHLVRVFIEDGIRKTKAADYSGKVAMKQLLNMRLTGGPKDLSENLDHYLYGGPRKRN